MTSFHYTLEVLTWYLPCSVSLTDFEMNERKMGEYHPVKNSIVPTEKKMRKLRYDILPTYRGIYIDCSPGKLGQYP